MDLLTLSLLTLIASVIGTITGFGTSTILVTALSLKYPLVETLLFVVIIHIFGDFWKILLFKKRADLKLIMQFGIVGIIFSYFGAKTATVIPENLLKGLLGIFLMTYVVFIWIKPKWKIQKSSSNALLGGALSGIFSGLFGVGGTIRSAFLAAYNLEKNIFIFTSGLIGLLLDGSRFFGYLSSGVVLINFSHTTLIICIIVSYLGAFIAKRIVFLLPQKEFRHLITFFIFAAGSYYLLSSF